jgi:D-alanyl-D-alanine dipeptidase
MRHLVRVVLASGALALAWACATTARSNPGGLVDVTTLDPLIQVELRYATSSNPLGRPVFAEKRALLIRPAAEAFARASRDMYPHGYLLFVLDAYRPASVSRAIDSALGPDRRSLSSTGAEADHERGCAVDVSLWDPADKKEASMTSAWGDVSARAAPASASSGAIERYRLEQLIEVMRRNGFEQSPDVWWHWEHAGCRTAPALDVPFSRIAPTIAPTPTPAK